MMGGGIGLIMGVDGRAVFRRCIAMGSGIRRFQVSKAALLSLAAYDTPA